MEKILLAMQGSGQNTYAIDFACYLAKLTGSRLTGVFLEGEEEDRAQSEAGAALRAAEPVTVADYLEEGRPADPGLRHVDRFRVHRDRGVPLGAILRESRFTDLIVIDPETSFLRLEREFPGHFVRDVLLSAECPVVVSPYNFETLDKVIFTYNGSASAVYAIKQFTYLFPEFRARKAVVVSVRKVEGEAIEEQFKMKEWFSAHYTDVEFVVLKGDASDELFGYLLEKKDAMVVLGSYGRGVLSRFFKPSHAGLLMRTINLPFFIAHR
jgi:nucleotide-binding universal stress UspA family protein